VAGLESQSDSESATLRYGWRDKYVIPEGWPVYRKTHPIT